LLGLPSSPSTDHLTNLKLIHRISQRPQRLWLSDHPLFKSHPSSNPCNQTIQSGHPVLIQSQSTSASTVLPPPTSSIDRGSNRRQFIAPPLPTANLTSDPPIPPVTGPPMVVSLPNAPTSPRFQTPQPSNRVQTDKTTRSRKRVRSTSPLQPNSTVANLPIPAVLLIPADNPVEGKMKVTLRSSGGGRNAVKKVRMVTLPPNRFSEEKQVIDAASIDPSITAAAKANASCLDSAPKDLDHSLSSSSLTLVLISRARNKRIPKSADSAVVGDSHVTTVY
jgi:hypothetical protein